MNNLNNENDRLLKTHEEILELIDEIKIFEENFQDFIVEKAELDVKEELIDIEPEKPKIIKPIPIKQKEKKEKHIIKPFFKTNTPATFKIRFNENGELVNLDFKKSKNQKVKKTKKKFSLKNIKNLRKKSKEKSEVNEGKSKSGKLKGGLGKLGKLKKAIPSKSKKKEKTEPYESKD